MSSNSYRTHVVILHAALIAWQTYIALFAFRSGDALRNLLTGLGAEIGPGVSLFLLTHRWWLIVPAACAALAFAAVRRLETRPSFSVAVLAAEAVTAVLLNIYWREAWFGPVLKLIERVN